jgi:hypothetical protein
MENISFSFRKNYLIYPKIILQKLEIKGPKRITGEPLDLINQIIQVEYESVIIDIERMQELE